MAARYPCLPKTTYLDPTHNNNNITYIPTHNRRTRTDTGHAASGDWRARVLLLSGHTGCVRSNISSEYLSVSFMYIYTPKFAPFIHSLQRRSAERTRKHKQKLGPHFNTFATICPPFGPRQFKYPFGTVSVFRNVHSNTSTFCCINSRAIARRWMPKRKLLDVSI